jgi:2-dehydro-3-deoxygluconokinase
MVLATRDCPYAIDGKRKGSGEILLWIETDRLFIISFREMVSCQAVSLLAGNISRGGNKMLVDVVSFGETMFRLTTGAGQRLEVTPSLQIFVGGTESNTLSCLSRLGLNVRWLSALPSNPLGRHVETELRRHGVDTSGIVRASESSRLGTFYVEESPDPLGLQVYYDRAHSACALIDPEAVDYSVVDDARLLHLTGITPALSAQARAVFQRFLTRAREKQVPLSFDVNYRAKLWPAAEAARQIEEACQQARILFCARADAVELWGFTGSPSDILRQMAHRFQSQDGEKTLVLTLGHEGSARWEHGEYQHEPVVPTAGTMRFGSGDAFSAGYLYAHLAGPLFQEVHTLYDVTPLRFGNALASLKRCIPGDIAVITPADVRALFQKGGRFR